MGEDETLPDVIRDLNIKVSALWGNADEGKPPRDSADATWRGQAFPWTVTLYIGELPNPRKEFRRPKSLTVSYWMGSAHRAPQPMGEKPIRRDELAPLPPTAADVLSSLASDISGIEGADFASWARDMDMNPDSISALDTFRACRAVAPRLRAFLGADFDRVMRAASSY